jgi:hypothetical protein
VMPSDPNAPPAPMLPSQPQDVTLMIIRVMNQGMIQWESYSHHCQNEEGGRRICLSAVVMPG